MILDRQHVAGELRRRIVRRLLLFRLQTAPHVLDFGSGIQRLAVRILQLLFKLCNAVVLGDFRSCLGGLAADFLRFFKSVFVLDHAINLVRALAVKSTSGMTRA